MDNVGTTPIELGKVSIVVRHSIVKAQPVFGGVTVFFLANGIGIRSFSAKNLSAVPVRVVNERSHGSHGIYQSVSVLDGLDATGDGLEHTRVIQVVVHRLVVPVDGETTTLWRIHPDCHFVVKYFQVIEHGLSGSNSGPRTQHGLVVGNPLAFFDGPIHQPVGGSYGHVFLKDLQSVYGGSVGTKGIFLEIGVSHVRNEDGSTAPDGWVVVCVCVCVCVWWLTASAFQ